ncbi:ZYBA0S11-00826g1_1 [Zygosaccharomyces bailii CLIB 213]|uniref:Mannosyltransferase n=1 Tax=Zygosaccharomyces bailii (strain CLIB 213 / ATCC 58445 / CBS 680 / BCRC 21525 / NBRC 1098 / NCYC 1416 / NRRL Y-2227) TaxID=1333698 RepID=A0A8J2TA23_ZYGB2|nr:ZYBA0S11-00826g1_1 [Zygosaccharomyces bailii CLIB 213]
MGWSYLDYAVVAIISWYMMKAPYTKVEESFTIQAIHDILNYGVFDISRYDHLQFPGVVPRSFIGPLIIAAFTKPFVWASSLFGTAPTQLESQMLARAAIGLTNWVGLVYLKNCAQDAISMQKIDNEREEEKNKEIGKSVGRRPPEVYLESTGIWYTLFVMTGFHLMYYGSRPLPNFVITLPLTNVALGWVLLGRHNLAVCLLAFTAAIFRLEVAALGGGVALLSIYYKKMTLFNAVKFGLMGGVIGMGISLTIDSHFWGRWCVPEIDAFIFNVIQGNAAEWGTESPAGYFTHYMGTMFVPPTILFLCLVGLKMAPQNLRIVALSGLFHVVVLSLQPHKEWRFIIYAVPPIILLGSVAAAYVWENLKIATTLQALVAFALPLSPVLSMLFSLVFGHASSLNYPGGQALSEFNQMIIANNITNATVHLSVPACMTGITKFGELDYDTYGITYDKTEDVAKLEDLWPTFEYLITVEDFPSMLPFEKYPAENWEKLSATPIFLGFDTTDFDTAFKDGEGLVGLITRLLQENANFATFVSDLIDSAFMRGDVFFTYKRIAHDSEHIESK